MKKARKARFAGYQQVERAINDLHISVFMALQAAAIENNTKPVDVFKRFDMYNRDSTSNLLFFVDDGNLDRGELVALVKSFSEAQNPLLKGWGIAFTSDYQKFEVVERLA